MRNPATIDDPRHYTAHDGRILPVGGTHEAGEPCGTCNLTPTRPVNFAVGQRVEFAHRRGSARRALGVVSAVGHRWVTVLWTTKDGRRRETKRLARDLSAAQVSR